MEGGGADADASMVEQSRPGKMGRLHGDDGQRGILKALGHKGKDWKGRFFVIKDNFMHYFKKEGDARPDGVIPLEGCTVAPVEKGGKVGQVRGCR